MDFDISVIGQQLSSMVDRFFTLLPQIVFGIIVLSVFIFSAKYVQRFVRNIVERGRNTSQAGIAFGMIARYVTIIVGILISIVIIFPGANVTTLLGSLGVGGVVIGFAFQSILQNFVAGLVLLFQEPFRIGDQIIAEGFEGTVRKIELRSTTLQTYDGRDAVIPNSDLFTNSILVNTAHAYRRSEYDVGIGYGDDIDHALHVMLQAVKSVDGVLQDPAPDALVWELADFAVVLRARWWTQSTRGELVVLHHQVLRAIKYAFNDAAIDMPYPTQVTLLHNQTEDVDGDRSLQREGWPVALNGQKQSVPARRTHEREDRINADGNHQA